MKKRAFTLTELLIAIVLFVACAMSISFLIYMGYVANHFVMKYW